MTKDLPQAIFLCPNPHITPTFHAQLGHENTSERLHSRHSPAQAIYFLQNWNAMSHQVWKPTNLFDDAFWKLPA